MVSKEIRAIIEPAAKKYGIDPNLIEAFVMQESSGDTMALRYEPAFYDRYCKDLPLTPTEKLCRAMSWGLMQVMGQVARELGYKGPYLSNLLSPEIGIDYGCRHLKNKLEKYHFNVKDAIAAYNAGIARKVGADKYFNQAYVEGVLNYLSKIEKEVSV